MNDINLQDWLLNEVGTGTDSQTGTPAGPPMGQPTMGGMPAQQGPDPSMTNMPQEKMAPNEAPKEEMPDAMSDPQTPDMPAEKSDKDFESWKKDFIAESVKGDIQTMKEMLQSMQNKDLDSYQHKFVSDNYNIIGLREYENITKASKEIRKSLKEELDHNNPATTVANAMSAVLETKPVLNSIFIKLSGLYSLKADLHRKYIASLLGAVQVGSGGANEDIIYNEEDYSIRISTRMNSRFGEVHIGEWALRQDDPERYLKPPELDRLENGSPEEKDVLRKRIVLESIAETFKTRAFIVTVVGSDGTIYTMGWDIASSLKSAYTEGRLLVKTKKDDAASAVIEDDGTIVPLTDWKITFVENKNEMEDGNREVDFIMSKYGQLFLVAPLPIIREASTAFQGLAFKETPWQGNPSDLKALVRCVPSSFEMVCRQC